MTKIVVFCLKFRLSPVCEYLNYYYNITNNYWVIPEKTQTREFQDIAFWKKFPEVFRFFYFTHGNSRKNGTLPLQIP